MPVVLEQGLKLRKEKTLKILTLVAMPVVLEQGLKPVSSNLRRPPSPGLPHGKFLPWIADEFEMSEDTATNFMRVYSRFGEIPKFSEFKPSVLYTLAAPSTPDSVVEKAIEKAEAGECRNYRSHVDFKSPHQKQETPTGAWLIGVFICRVQHKNIVRSCSGKISNGNLLAITFE